ncbi:MAG: hypothetical protein U0944_00070, partial [Candidatus Moranbacteria bacterium]|nr:hypothetical protein [Candidatus Moranbacteria bacterium]
KYDLDERLRSQVIVGLEEERDGLFVWNMAGTMFFLVMAVFLYNIFPVFKSGYFILGMMMIGFFIPYPLVFLRRKLKRKRKNHHCIK